MTTDEQMAYEPMVGDKVGFVVYTVDNTYSERGDTAERGDQGVVVVVAGDTFYVDLAKGGRIFMHQKASQRIPHDLMRIECVDQVPTPCCNQVDVDAVMRRCADKVTCDDVELKVLTVMEMCRELRRYRLEEKEKLE